MTEKNRIIQGNCVDVMSAIDIEVDMVITSPPYDNLRSYGNDLSWNEDVWRPCIEQICRLLKQGGVCVWIVGDATIKGSETGSSFRQALYFMECGLNLHDTMIWNKNGFSAVGSLKYRYAPVFEYMFIFSKGHPKTFNPIKDRPNKHSGKTVSGTIRQTDGSTKPMSKKMIINEYGQRFNIWEQSPHRQRGGHPAPFPVQLIEDHILSWTNIENTVLDPFFGSGTTGVACQTTGRNFIGIEINSEYIEMAKKRMDIIDCLRAENEALHDRIENLEAQIAILTSDPFPKLPPIEDMTND